LTKRETCFLYIALVSEQNAPLLLGLLADAARNEYPTHIHLLYTNDAASKDQVPNLIAGLPVTPLDQGEFDAQGFNKSAMWRPQAAHRLSFDRNMATISPQVVDPWDAEAIRDAVLDTFKEWDFQRAVVDCTPGTKMMFDGAREAVRCFRHHEPNKDVIARYVNTSMRRYQSFDGNRWLSHVDFPNRFEQLSLLHFLTVQGWQAQRRGDTRPYAAEKQRLGRLILSYPRVFQKTRDLRIDNPVTFGGDEPWPSVIDDAVMAQLISQGAGGWGWRAANNEALKWWSGTWLEDAFYAVLACVKEKALIENNMVITVESAVHFTKFSETYGPTKSGGDIDDAVLAGGRVLLFEAKDYKLEYPELAGDAKRKKDKEDAARSRLRSEMYKLAQQRRAVGGALSKAYLVHPEWPTTGGGIDLRSDIELMGIELLDVKQLVAGSGARTADDRWNAIVQRVYDLLRAHWEPAAF
jgi:hypothetical protein